MPCSVLRVCVLALVALPLAARAEDWPCWRGPRGDGTSLEQNVPVHWSVHENIAWKITIPGVGHSSPVVWQDRIFLVTCLEESGDRVLLCLDRDTGRAVWQQTVVQAPLEGKHDLNSYASSTPATDGESVYVTFLDDDDMVVAAYDFADQKRWLSRPGEFHSKHGYCSCPVLFEDKVIVNGDHDGDAYLVALPRDGQDAVENAAREQNTQLRHPHRTRDLRPAAPDPFGQHVGGQLRPA